MSEHRDEGEPEDKPGDDPRDTESDPGLGDQDDASTDWSSEGGAVPEGPATDAD